MTERTDFRAIRPDPPGEDQIPNERRFRAAVETAFDLVDNAMTSLNRRIGNGSGDDGCCSNLDGGMADTNYGGIFCLIDGGDASGAANTTP